MHALVRAAAAVSVLAALASLDRGPRAPLGALVSAPAEAPGVEGLPALCGPRTVPDGVSCAPLPEPGTVLDTSRPLAAEPGAHRTPNRGWETYEQIPRRPDRPADLARYVVPLDGVPKILSEYDLNRPSAEQRQGPSFKVTGHGALDFAGKRGDPVKLVALEHQEGDAEVVLAGELFGITVATEHLVREAGQIRAYVVLYGHLERVAAGVAPGAHPHPGDSLGFVGDSGSPGIVHLHLEVRQVREGVDVHASDPHKLADGSVSIPCDPRNVLVLRAP
jgi:murein DD-endopeptidase MepM/ murein hydrolase activator NlpD